jgi:uncharacterized low-complexity protein
MYALILAAALGANDYTLCANDYQITPVRKTAVVVKVITKSVVVKKQAITGSCANGQCGTSQRPVRTFRRWFR